MARSLTLTAALLAVAWVLMVSYQVFAKNALNAVTGALSMISPVLVSVLVSGSVVVVFVCSFAWMFVLSAVISSLMFGRERRLSVQFLVSLALTFTGTGLLYLLTNVVGVNPADPSVLTNPFLPVFNNVVFSFFYLTLPFIFMVALDLRAATKRSRRPRAKR
jgi:hypothetical protein